MAILFNDFRGWQAYCAQQNMPLYFPVLEYEIEQKGRTEMEIWDGLRRAWTVMRDAVQTGLTEEMVSRSGMINNGLKRWPKPSLFSLPSFRN